MNREEIKKVIFATRRINLVELISIEGTPVSAQVESMIPYLKTMMTIDKIYDDFKNRTCESCLYYDDCQILDILHDENADMEDYEFSCNRWEQNA